MHFEEKLRSCNTSYCLIEMVFRSGLTVDLRPLEIFCDILSKYPPELYNLPLLLHLKFHVIILYEIVV